MLKLQAKTAQVEAGTWTWSLESVSAAGVGTTIANGAVAHATTEAAEADLRTLLASLDAMGATAYSIPVVARTEFVAP